MNATDRDALRGELRALTRDELELVAALLVADVPDAVRHALEVERATRPAATAEEDTSG